MPAKKITRKIISKGKRETLKEEKPQAVVEEVPREARPKRFCLFCKHKITPTYTDIATLRRFLTDRAKIVAKQRSGVCSKHQRAVAKNIKYARHLALLPFTPKV
ncbi:MAG: ribosomal protein S18P [Microgenomates group bacterium Gr01-1014_7]|nr:MAG: ribosomal protein S18P [Microgenomates group bacterium Gr01-1014_7]